MLDLFDAPVVPGIVSRADVVTCAEEHALIAAIDGQALTPFRFQGYTGKRLTHSFGWNYDFETAQLGRAAPMPAWLAELRDRMAVFAGLAPTELVQALLIRYDVGAGIGWHRDRPLFEHVVGLSLGASATLRLRRRVGDRWLRAALPLPARGAYHLSGEARHAWEHSIVEMGETRHSITFRTLSDKGHRLARSTL